ncbi:MAG: hypothetical protein ACRC31_01825 [Cetobacterium sp.]
MELLREYNISKSIQIIKVENELADLVVENGLSVGDIVVSKIGDFHYDINYTGFVSVLEFGVCPDYDLKNRYDVIDDNKAKKLVKSILKYKEPSRAKDMEIEQLREQVETLKKESKSKPKI